MKNHLIGALRTACFLAGAPFAAAVVQADVTLEQRTTLDVASVIRTHGSSTTNVAADKKREDTESHCEGLMSLVCGNVRSGEIVRLDRGLTWHLEPDKKRYREDVFATPEELAAMRSKMQARLEKMRSCPVPQKQQPIDKSKCQMSPPKIDVHKTDDKMSFAGHEAQRTVATLTETCTNKDTGDVCDTVIAIDLWLTQDKLPGAGDRRTFDQAYAKKLGLTDEQGALRGEFTKFLAPYQSQIKQLTDKSSDLKGQSLKTSLRVMIGGQQCSAAKVKANGSANTDNSASAAGNPMANVAQAGKAIGSSVGNLVGGMFHKKKPSDAPTAASAAAPPDAATAASASPSTAAPTGAPGGGAADPYAQFLQMATFTTETVTINADTIPADRFEVPGDWKKEEPKASKQVDDDVTCPKSQG
jgi:hypothetical protein